MREKQNVKLTICCGLANYSVCHVVTHRGRIDHLETEAGSISIVFHGQIRRDEAILFLRQRRGRSRRWSRDSSGWFAKEVASQDRSTVVFVLFRGDLSEDVVLVGHELSVVKEKDTEKKERKERKERENSKPTTTSTTKKKVGPNNLIRDLSEIVSDFEEIYFSSSVRNLKR